VKTENGGRDAKGEGRRSECASLLTSLSSLLEFGRVGILVHRVPSAEWGALTNKMFFQRNRGPPGNPLAR